MTATARASDLTRLTLVEASNAVRDGEVTSVSLTQAALDGFRVANPTLNASIALEREEALERREEVVREQAERIGRLEREVELLRARLARLDAAEGQADAAGDPGDPGDPGATAPGVAVQDVPYSRLRDRLLKDGQVLEYPDTRTRAPR